MARWIATLILAALPLAGCASEFQPTTLFGGDEAHELAPDLFRITASGGLYTDFNDVQQRLLVKAAQTTLENGATHFLVRATPSIQRNTAIVTGDISSDTASNEEYRRPVPKQSMGVGQETYIQILRIPPGEKPPAAAISAKEITTFIGKQGPKA